MPAPKGHKKWGGRTKSTPNKVTKSMREAWIDAFEQMGGVESLVKWGQKNQTAFYSLASKLIPIDITSGGNPLSAPQIIVQPSTP